MNSFFENKLLKESFENNIPRVKMQNAIQLYLNSDIKIKKTSSTSISCIIDKKVIEIKSDVGISYIVDGIKSKKDEYSLACLLAFKRNYLADNDIKFNKKDLILENNYYNNTYITFYNIDEYKLRISFYIGLINYLFKLEMIDECLQYIVDIYMMLFENFQFDNKYKSEKHLFKYLIIKNKYQFITYNYKKVIELFNKKTDQIRPIAEFLYTIVVNYPETLKENNIVDFYDYILNGFNKYDKYTQRYKDLCIHKKVANWYLKNESEDIMINHIDMYEVRFCYVKYLFEHQRYEQICNLFKNNNFNIPNQEINYLITYAFYICEDYNGAVNIFNRFNGITYERYMSHKEKFPLLFEDIYLDQIITYIIDNYNTDEVNKILDRENLKKYEVILLARTNFEILDNRFDEFLGKYDDLLIKVYQKEIINICNHIVGRYNYIPEILLKKFEKMKKIKNGKYYVAETINAIKDNYYMSFKCDLDTYLSNLGV